MRVVLCKIIFHKDVISNSNFERPQSINRFYFSLISFVDLFISNQKQEFWKTSVRKKICNRNSRSVNFPCECEFSLRKTNTKYELLRTCFSRTLATDKLPLTNAFGTFLFSKFVCIWFLLLRARIQSLKESRVVAIESFSIELKACVRYFLSNFYFSQNDIPSKTMKNVFYFI